MQFLADGGLIVGASGGSMQLTKNVSLFRLLTESLEEVFANRDEYEGLGFAGYEILPHLNRLDTSFLETVQRYSERVTHDVIALQMAQQWFTTGTEIIGALARQKYYAGAFGRQLRRRHNAAAAEARREWLLNSYGFVASPLAAERQAVIRHVRQAWDISGEAGEGRI